MSGRRGRIGRSAVLEFVALLAFWFALSQRFEPLFVVLGVITAAVVTALTRVITGSALRPGLSHLSTSQLLLVAVRAVSFAVWMVGRILASSMQVAHVALSRRMPLEPCTLRFRTELRSPVARTVLTNSISMVPGTLTVEIEHGWVTVHALDPSHAEDLLSGRLQNKVAALFLDGPQPPARREDLMRGSLR